MKSEGQQIDFIERQREVLAYYVASEAALHNPYFSERERQERADYYRQRAAELEGTCQR